MATKRTAHDSARTESAMPTPFIDVDALMAIQRSNFDTMVQANRIFVEAAQAIAGCQSEMMRDYVEHMSQAIAELTSGAQPGDKAAREAVVAQKLFEKTAGHVRQIAELIGKTNAETIELMNGRVRSLMDDARTGSRRALRESVGA
jgi:phasin family protein